MMLLSDVLQIYIMDKTVAGRRPKTIAWYQIELERFIEFAGDKPVADLNLEDGQKWVLHMMQANRYEGHPNRKEIQGPVSVSTINGRIRAIKNFSKYLDEEGFTEADVFRKIHQQREPRRVVEVLSDEEKNRLIDATKPDTMLGCRMLVILALLIDTGMRVSELAGIKLEDVDFKQSRILVTGKGGKQRFVPIGPNTVKVLIRWINRYRPNVNDNALLIDREAKPMSTSAIQKSLKVLGTNVGIPRIHPHLLRHSFGTDWLIHGGDLFSLQEVLGHSDLETTKVYVEMSRVQLDVKHRAISPFDRLGVAKKLKKTGT